ncbi:MAG: RNase adapter RapZ [Ruminococcus sp.]|nr:RNase adapter RapZ [Ruminococcus sp.]
MQVVVVTGMSGSGKSSAMDVLEDIGYYCIDNLPPQLMGRFIEICRESENRLERIAIAADLRSGEMFANAYRCLHRLERQQDLDVKILYIDAEDEVLVKRYKETRRKHPLDEKFSGNLHQAIAFEREQLVQIKGIADYYIETSYQSASQLKEQIREIFLENKTDSMSIKVTSFGFKYGVSTESDLVFDVRCLPNPYYVKELRSHTGCEACVQDYVMSFEQSQQLMQKLTDLLDFLIPLYIHEGKSRLVISFGCTGGKHRSITFAERIGDHLTAKGMRVIKQHRDIEKDRP